MDIGMDESTGVDLDVAAEAYAANRVATEANAEGAATNARGTTNGRALPTIFDATMLTMMNHNGMEVVFAIVQQVPPGDTASVNSPAKHQRRNYELSEPPVLLVVDARDYFVIQRLDMIPPQRNRANTNANVNVNLTIPTFAPVVSLTAHPDSGTVVVVQQDGTLTTFTPQRTCSPQYPDQQPNATSLVAPTALPDGHSSNTGATSPATIPAMHGKYNWRPTCQNDLNHVFVAEEEEEGEEDDQANGAHWRFMDRRYSKVDSPADSHFSCVDVSQSQQKCFLVSHGSQIALFDGLLEPPCQPNPAATSSTSTSVPLSPTASSRSNRLPTAKLIWTTMCSSRILTAKLSGDGRSIVAVLEEDNQPAPTDPTAVNQNYEYSTEQAFDDDVHSMEEIDQGMQPNQKFGCRTFIHDLDDGFAYDVAHNSVTNLSVGDDNDAQSQMTGQVTKAGATSIDQLHRSNLERASSVGRVYKSGPFLPHSSPVTRISFRSAVGQTSAHFQPSSASGTSSGRNTANHFQDEAYIGTDLLLTYCKDRSTVRIFQQSDWSQCMGWTTSPDTRADFVSGSVAFTLGDLEPLAPATKNRSTKRRNGGRSLSRHNSGASDSTGSLDPALISRAPNGGLGMGSPPTIGSTSNNILAAGAWIAELTFRHSSFPALRLSRLSYMHHSSAGSGRHGLQTAHFESVAAILPCESLDAESILQSDDLGFCIHGIWPAWNPWTATGGLFGNAVPPEDLTKTLSGSAMAFLGLAGNNGINSGGTPSNFPGGSGGFSAGGGGLSIHGNPIAMGGTHAPPSELRIFASNPNSEIVTMEFPLWGDEEFGSMELGSPLRHVLNLAETAEVNTRPAATELVLATSAMTNSGTMPAIAFPTPAAAAAAGGPVSMKHESSRLCAQIDPFEQRSIHLTWRRQGGIVLHSPDWDQQAPPEENALVAHKDDPRPNTPLVLQDWTKTPIPLSLPSLELPDILPPFQTATTVSKKQLDVIIALSWFADDSFGCPPVLLALMSSGNCVLFEIPPPIFALEPNTPSYDPLSGNSVNSAGSTGSGPNSPGNFNAMGGQIGPTMSEMDSDVDDESDHYDEHEAYTVMVTPHPDFGLGLRLESPMDGMPAVAGSFKKNPLNDGMLPVEKTGMIMLGDELLSVNGVSLENMTFDDIIGTVRHVGAESGPGEALRLQFRPSQPRPRRSSMQLASLAFAEAPSVDAEDRNNDNRNNHGADFASDVPKKLKSPGRTSTTGSSNDNSNRRSMEQILGVPPSKVAHGRPSGHRRHASDGGNSLISYIQSQPISEFHQQFGRVLMETKTKLPHGFLSSDASTVQQRFLVIPTAPKDDADGPPVVSGLVIVASRRTLHVKHLISHLDGNDDLHSTGSLIDLGVYEIEEPTLEEGDGDGDGHKEVNVRIQSIQSVSSTGDTYCLLVTDNISRSFFVFIDFDMSTHANPNVDVDERIANQSKPSATMRGYPAFTTRASTEAGQELRSAKCGSLGTIATLNASGQLQVWTARPDPAATEGAPGKLQNEYLHKDYVMETILLPDTSTEAVDFAFPPMGTLDAHASLVVFTSHEAILYQRRGSSKSYSCVLQVKYTSTLNEPAIGAATKTRDSEEMPSLHRVNPQDAFPHIMNAIIAAIDSYDEQHFHLPDWSPESLLAHLCTMEQGAKLALDRHVKAVLLWLANRINDRPMDNAIDAKLPLHVCPFDEIGGVLLLEAATEDEKADSSGDDATALLATITTAADASDGANSDETKVFKETVERLKTVLAKPRKFKSSNKKSSLHWSSSSGLGASILSASKSAHDDTLPPILKMMGPDELRVLWALCDFSLKSPNNSQLDVPGQLATTIHALHESLQQAPEIEKIDESADSRWDAVSGHAFQVRRALSSISEANAKPAGNASAGCLGALLSDCQTKLIDDFRPKGGKLGWEQARSLKMPFWIRSDDKLREICEEIGQHTYRETRDIMKSALFLIAAGKLRTLRNLAAADHTMTGKKFFKFVTGYDFSSERGRRAAEKNAFSLLRKNQYEPAAAFFLLAQPPILKSAVETIATKLNDLSLAFLVARLVTKESTSKSGPGMGGGSAFPSSFGGFGGGGGYAASEAIVKKEVVADKEKFCDWKPRLTKIARDVLQDRGLPGTTDDSCLSAIQCLWLGQRHDAANWLSNLFGSESHTVANFVASASLPRIKSAERVKNDKHRAMRSMNALINFIAGPLLLKMMGTSRKALLSSSLTVATSLMHAGIDLPSIRCLVQGFQESEEEEKEHVEEDAEKSSKAAAAGTGSGAATSSIFDSFDAPRPANQQPGATSGTSSGMVSSSIFDSFDAPKPKPATAQSSIFDSFDAAPPKPAKAPAPAPSSGQMASSIFDSFDTAPPPRKPAPAPAPAAHSGQMASSIFDSFDAAPPHRKPVPAPTPASIFDAYDVNPQEATKPKSMLEQFGGPPSANNASKASDQHQKGPTPNPVSPLDFVDLDEVNEGVAELVHLEVPELWMQWQQETLLEVAARRVVREVATITSTFHGDTFFPDTSACDTGLGILVPRHASQVLQFDCNGDDILDDINACLDGISTVSGLDRNHVGCKAVDLIRGCGRTNRLMISVLLQLAIGQTEVVEDTIRHASSSLIQDCQSVSLTNDRLSEKQPTLGRDATLHSRRQAANMSWQLELCLWLHRSGVFPLTGIALSEMIAATRIGMIIASWNKDFDCMQTMIKYEPDCLVDELAGRQLWGSLKMIPKDTDKDKSSGGNNHGGGWEFLVDCRRAEATKLLKSKQTGRFILRPHAEEHGVFTLSFKTNLAPADDVVQHAIIRLSDTGFRCGSFGPFATLMKLLEAVSASLPFDLRFDLPPTEDMLNEEKLKPSPNATFFRKFGLMRSKQLKAGNTPDGPAGLLNLDEGDEEAQGSDDTGDNANVNINAHANANSNADAPIESPNPEVAVQAKKDNAQRAKQFGLFLELLVLTKFRTQLSGIVSARYEDTEQGHDLFANSEDMYSIGSLSDDLHKNSVALQYSVAVRMLRPFLNWCRRLELDVLTSLSPDVADTVAAPLTIPIAFKASETAIEISPAEISTVVSAGDKVIRQMIKRGSGVQFRTMRLGDGNDSAMVVLFSKREAMEWLVESGTEKSTRDAFNRLRQMEISRVIEAIDFKQLAPKLYKDSVSNAKEKQNAQAEATADASTGAVRSIEDTEGIRYRIVDPWEVEPLRSREAETLGASLGRHRLHAFSLAKVSASCSDVFRTLGGSKLLELWVACNGGVTLSKALASAHPPWERGPGVELANYIGGGAGGADGLTILESQPFMESIRQHLYRNALYRRLGTPQRFLALIQVELLDLKNLTAPSGSLSLSVYSLLRLKRSSSNSSSSKGSKGGASSGKLLSHKARTLDSVATAPVRLGKTMNAGPNAPASWGSLVRFRFPLPEFVQTDGASQCNDREALFKGPPTVLQLAVYEKKFMSDSLLGAADVKLDGLGTDGQLEEWVPLQNDSYGIHWFARIRLTLRFELLCLNDPVIPQPGDADASRTPVSDGNGNAAAVTSGQAQSNGDGNGGFGHSDGDELAPSVGLKRIQQLTDSGGVSEDIKKSVSTPDLLSYFEGIVY